MAVARLQCEGKDVVNSSDWFYVYSAASRGSFDWVCWNCSLETDGESRGNRLILTWERVLLCQAGCMSHSSGKQLNMQTNLSVRAVIRSWSLCRCACASSFLIRPSSSRDSTCSLARRVCSSIWACRASTWKHEQQKQTHATCTTKLLETEEGALNSYDLYSEGDRLHIPVLTTFGYHSCIVPGFLHLPHRLISFSCYSLRKQKQN